MVTAERLVESTRELLWERGYSGTSPKGILARAETGQSSMYHHFKGKADLAAAAIDRTAQEMRAEIDKQFSAPGTALDRITAYLLREREVLKGCPIGRLTQEPEVIAEPQLREPIRETFAWLTARVAQVIAEGRDRGELRAEIDPVRVASMIVAVLQGGYVLARAAGDPAEFSRAAEGALILLEQHKA